MSRFLNSHALAGALIAAGTIISVASIYVELPGSKGGQASLSNMQWLGVAVGLLIAFVGVGLFYRDRIRASANLLLGRAWARIVQNWPVLLAAY
jgi:hypothetical protein